VFRVDPARVPGPGIRARCSVCGGIIPITSARSWTDDFATPHDAASLTSTSSRAGGMGAATAATVGRAVETRLGAGALGAARVSPPADPRSPTPTRVPPFAPGRRQTPPVSPAVLPSAAAPPQPRQPSPAQAAHAGSPAVPAGVPQPRPTAPAPVASPRAPDVPIGAPLARTAPIAATPAPSVAPPPTVRPPLSTREAPAAPGRSAAAASTPSKAPINPFLANDPNQKAKRLARALVSDMVAYHPQKRDEGMRAGTLKQLFREEIKKSYEEYVEQIGKEFAESTSHFQDALNDVLAGGKKVF
jgi:hypothetical protein